MFSNHQTMADDFTQLSDVISYQESSLSENGGSLIGDSSITPQYAAENSEVLQHIVTNYRANIQETSLNTNGNPAFSGCSYLPDLPRDHFLCERQGNQLHYPNFARETIVSPYQASFPSMMAVKKPRLEATRSRNRMQLTVPDPNSPAAMLYQHQFIPNQQKNQTPPCVPSTQRVMHHLPLDHMVGVEQKQLDAVTAMNARACIRRLNCYMYHLRNRPVDSNISYWRKFVAEYYSPSTSSRRRWCLSKCDNVGSYAHGIDPWKCDLCRSNTGKGFEVTYEVLPRMYEVYFGSGVIDEIMYLDSPIEKRYPSGVMVLQFEKAVQESVYKQFRVIHEGKLRVAFSPELKIISWEFCIHRHDELLVRRFVAAQVNELVEHAEKCQCKSEVDESETHNLVTNCLRVLASGRNLATSLQLPLVNEFGFSKPFARFLQIFGVMNRMKDLMTATQNSNTSSPIEILRRYPQAVNTKLKGHMEDQSQMHQIPNAVSIPQQPLNFMAQPPNEVLNSQNHQQFLQQRIQSDNEHNFNSKPPFYPSANISIGPSSSRPEPTIQQQINDLLLNIRAEGPIDKCAKIAAGKRKLVNDPNYYEATQIGVFTEQNGMLERGKVLKESSRSNSCARICTYNYMIKEPDSDEHLNAPNGYQQMLGKSSYH